MRAAIVLAAGASRRFGRADKLLARVRGAPLMARALGHALASDARRVILVTTPRRRAACRRLPEVARHGARLRFVRAPCGDRGLAHSLAAGVRALRPIERELWVFLADMPCATAPHGLRLRAREQAVRPLVAGCPGHPMLVRTAAARIALGAGDRGLAVGMAPGSIRYRPGTAGNILDIDDRAALRRYRWRAR